MTADVAFESAQEIAEKLSLFEELFKHRYTDKDEGYNRALSRGSRWEQPPVMEPWPPRKPFSQYRRRYEDWDNMHNRRGGYRPRDRRPYHRGRPRFYDDRGRHRRHRSRSPAYGSRSPRDMDIPPGYRDHSPGRHHRPPDSPSPHHHPHHRTPSPHHLSPHYDQGRRSRSRTPGHSSPRRVPVAEQPPPLRPEEPEKDTILTDEAVGKDKEPELLPTPLLDLGFGETQDKAVPSESDVMAILSSASAGANRITSVNLKKMQKEAQLQANRKEKAKKKTINKPITTTTTEKDYDSVAMATTSTNMVKNQTNPSNNTLHISHGRTENVVTSLFTQVKDVVPTTKEPVKESEKSKSKKKRKRIVISDDEGEDHGGGSEVLIDVVGLHPSSSDSLSGDSTASSLVLHLDRKFYLQQSLSMATTSDISNDPSTYSAVQTDPNSTKLIIRSPGPSRTSSPVVCEESSVRKSSKKKKKKKARHDGGGRGEAEQEPLKLKISLGQP